MSSPDPSPGKITLIVNGETRRVAAAGSDLLVDTLRDKLNLTGVHVGCNSARCGACLIEIDGAPAKACTVLTGQVEGAEIRTVEALAQQDQLDPLQTAFRDAHALQCGFCTPGMLMAVRTLLQDNPNPSEAEIRQGLKGNLCRCTGYQTIVKAVQAYVSDTSDATNAANPDAGAVGTSPKRVEDARFLTGRGQYCADLNLASQLHAVFVRSEVPHARIVKVETREAENMPDVVAVLTGKDVAADQIGELRCGWTVHSRDGTPMQGGARPLLAHQTVRFVGDAFAVVLAESAEAARHAARRVRLKHEPLPHNISPTDASTSERLHGEAENNICFDWQFGDETGVEQILANAAHVTEIDLTNNRLIPNALEPRAALADYQPGRGSSVLYTTSQNPHMARKVITETLGFIDEHELRVISPDLGGGFGSKIFIYPEECVCLWASRHMGRPVKWVSSREEAFLTDAHGRDHVSTARLALDADHNFLAMNVETTANLGAYLSSFAAFVPTFLYATMLAGPYKTGTISCRVQGVFTNTAPVDAYRGAGRPEATYLLETLIDQAAREIGVDPVALRRKNFIRPHEFPYQTPVALEYDVGDYEAHLDRAMDLARVDTFQSRQNEAAAQGRLRGIGVSCYVEACGIAPSAVAGALGADVGLWESALLRFTPSGKLQVFTGSHSHGQGHETTFAQLVSDRFCLPLNEIAVIHGDTDKTPMGMGTYGSRSLAVGGSAILEATDKIIEKGKRIAAHLLNKSVDNIEFRDGHFHDDARNAHVPLQDVVHAAYVPHDYPLDLEPGLEASAFYDPINFTYPSGTHVCEVEIDPETGQIDLVAFTAVDDFGQIINPMIVDGQVQGGIAQGIGQALMEEALYNPQTGQPITRSYATYALPRATDLVAIETDTTFTACPSNPVGAKGCGEAGAIGAPPAFMNAVASALGVRIDMPATPEKIWRACLKRNHAD
ncbi:MAG: molybdopterin-dependent oxidoreductase [Hyphomonadaceae bacterium]|nr:molybdopterin-dependent oxidoreductase [Hyphomonadaceae bacterium]